MSRVSLGRALLSLLALVVVACDDEESGAADPLPSEQDSGSTMPTNDGSVSNSKDAGVDAQTAPDASAFVATRTYPGPCRERTTTTFGEGTNRRARNTSQTWHYTGEQFKEIEFTFNDEDTGEPWTSVFLRYVYDAAGFPVRVEMPQLPPPNPACTDLAALQTNTYDSMGRLIKAETDNNVDLDCGSIIDGIPERTSLYHYDSSGKLAQIEFSSVFGDMSEISVLDYERDGSGNTLRVKYSQGGETTAVQTYSVTGTPPEQAENTEDQAFGAPFPIQSLPVTPGEWSIRVEADGTCIHCVNDECSECVFDGTVDEIETTTYKDGRITRYEQKVPSGTILELKETEYDRFGNAVHGARLVRGDLAEKLGTVSSTDWTYDCWK